MSPAIVKPEIRIIIGNSFELSLFGAPAFTPPTGVVVVVEPVSAGTWSRPPMPGSVMLTALAKVAPLGQVTTKDAGPLPNPAGKLITELKLPFASVPTLVADSDVLLPLRNSAKLAVPFAFPVPQLPATLPTFPAVGFGLTDREFTAAGFTVIAEENAVPFEQCAVSVAGPVPRLVGRIMVLLNVPVGLKFTLPTLNEPLLFATVSCEVPVPLEPPHAPDTLNVPPEVGVVAGSVKEVLAVAGKVNVGE